MAAVKVATDLLTDVNARLVEHREIRKVAASAAPLVPIAEEIKTVAEARATVEALAPHIDALVLLAEKMDGASVDGAAAALISIAADFAYMAEKLIDQTE